MYENREVTHSELLALQDALLDADNMFDNLEKFGQLNTGQREAISVTRLKLSSRVEMINQIFNGEPTAYR
jgi:hypothetical protein